MTPTKHHILVADDDETFLLSTADLLRREGFQCACAEDAAAAADRLRSEKFDLLVTDVRMAGNSQLELVRQMPELASGVPVVLISAYPSVHIAAQAMRLPVVNYLFKPFELDELLKAVADGVRISTMNRLIVSNQARAEELRQQIALMTEVTAAPGGGRSAGELNVHAFLQLSLEHIVGSLSDVWNLVSGMMTGQPAKNACQMLDCPRTETLISAVRQAVGVLEKTKSSFKSKELGELRRSLLDVLPGLNSENEMLA